MRRFVLASILIGVLALGTGWMVWTRIQTETDARPVPSVVLSSRPFASNAASATVESGDSPIHFTLMTESSGIDFKHRSGNSSERPFPAANGSGIGSLDYDLDGNYDLYFATGRTFPLDLLDAAGTGNRLYRNEGHWKFTDVTATAGIGHLGYSAGIAVGDFDSDGFPDIYVSCVGPNVLYRNCGDGTFVSVGEAANVSDSRWGTSAACLDYDGDGELDIYSCNYASWSWETNQFCGNRTRGVRIFCSPSSVAPDRHLLFHKDADGRLNKVERTAAREFLKTNRGPGGPGGGGFNFFGGPPGGGPPGGGPGGPGGGPGGRPGGPGGGPGGFGGGNEPAKPGPLLSPKDVKPVADTSLYVPTVLRTLFLEFEDADWEAELADFNNTDVEVPATVTVDGVKYPNVGVHFRGMSSYMMVPAGSKRSLNLSFDFVDSKQRLYGYKTLNLLNSHDDPTFLHPVLYSHIARKHIPAPKVNLVKLAINGESWGVYSNAQQFNRDFLAENYPSSKGARWKVTGSPMGRGGLEYIGDNIEDYKRTFSLKTNDSEKDWKALVKLCKSLNETPLDQLEEALAPMLDIDEALWFLALDNALINCDGYWIRASDYALFRDDKGVFHIIPHDMNESFQQAMGPGMGGPGGPGGGMFGGLFGGGPGGGRPGEGRPGEGRPGEGRPPREGGPEGRGRPGEGDRPREGGRPGEGRPGEGRPRDGGPGGPPGAGGPGGGGPRGGNVDLDPLVGLTDKSKPLRSRLLAVPSLKAKYLAHVKQIAEESLDWKTLGPVVAQYEKLIGQEIEADTKKLSSYAAFQQTVSGTAPPAAEQRGRPHMGLKQFADQRRAFLLNHPEIKSLGATTSAK